jgi:hypothetical protein
VPILATKTEKNQENSEADPGFLYRTLDPGSNNNKKRGGKTKFVVLSFFVAKIFTKLKTLYF